MKSDDYLWFDVSLAGTLVICEILPILYTTDWNRLGFLLIAFDNWRTLFFINPNHALSHAPLLVEDPYVIKDDIKDDTQAYFSPFITPKNNNNNNDAKNNKVNDDIKLKIETIERSINQLTLDNNLIIPNYNQTSMLSCNTFKANVNEIEVCVRIFKCQNIELSILHSIVNNIKKLTNLRHRNMAQLYFIQLDEQYNVQIVSEWYSNASLFDIIEFSQTKNTPFSYPVIKRILYQIAVYLQWLHVNCGIPHGYLKSRNVLFDEQMNVKVTDMGLISLKVCFFVLCVFFIVFLCVF